MSKRPWIFEKSLPTTLVTESMASWLVTMTQTRPPQRVPSSSTMVCRFSIRLESEPMNCPISSTMKSRRNSPSELVARKSTYAFTWSTNDSMETEASSLPLSHDAASSSSMTPEATRARLTLALRSLNFFRPSSQGSPASASYAWRKASVLPSWSMSISSSATLRFLP